MPNQDTYVVKLMWLSRPRRQLRRERDVQASLDLTLSSLRRDRYRPDRPPGRRRASGAMTRGPRRHGAASGFRPTPGCPSAMAAALLSAGVKLGP